VVRFLPCPVNRFTPSGIVERLKEKNPSPTEFVAGDVIEIKALKRSALHPFNGRWGIVEHVGVSATLCELALPGMYSSARR